MQSSLLQDLLAWFTQARKLVSSSDIRVGKLYVVAFLLPPDGLHSVCLGLAYLAKQMCNLCLEDLGLFGSPARQCTWSLPQWLSRCSLVQLCRVPVHGAVLIPQASIRVVTMAVCLLPKPMHLASGFHLSCFQVHHANRRRSQGMCVFVSWRFMSSVSTLAFIQIMLKSIAFFWVCKGGPDLFMEKKPKKT